MFPSAESAGPNQPARHRLTRINDGSRVASRKTRNDGTPGRENHRRNGPTRGQHVRSPTQAGRISPAAEALAKAVGLVTDVSSVIRVAAQEAQSLITVCKPTARRERAGAIRIGTASSPTSTNR